MKNHKSYSETKRQLGYGDEVEPSKYFVNLLVKQLAYFIIAATISFVVTYYDLTLLSDFNY